MSTENNKKEEKLFYIENGMYVFTEAYHLKRGYCCENGCRHCPWQVSDGSKPSDAYQDSCPPDKD